MLSLARLYEHRGVQNLLKKELDQAIQSFNEAIALDPSRKDAYAHRATAYALKGEVEPALKDYSEAIRKDPADIAAHIGRGEPPAETQCSRRRSRRL